MSEGDIPATTRYRQLYALLVNFSLHCITGVFAVVVHYALMYLALNLGSTPVIATSIGFVGGAVTRFLLAYYHVFTPSRPKGEAAVHFVISLGIQMVLNAALLAGLLALGAAVWPAQLATTVLLTFINYAMYRLWVFT